MTCLHTNRATPVVDNIIQVSERFPGVFDLENQYYKQLFILITKTNQTEKTIQELLERLRNEETTTLQNLKNDSQGRVSVSALDESNISDSQTRLRVWKLLVMLFRQGKRICA